MPIAYCSHAPIGAPINLPMASVSGDRRVVRQKSKVRWVRSLTIACDELSSVHSTSTSVDAMNIAAYTSRQYCNAAHESGDRH